ncbi:excalibur calcium-binding domain-containing protein [Corynebacterium glyciniphilum]|uniref:excalibur calcium-binding domain-containing protein n=1 Tax=Corynebacterium glyciniphilum TaxID=1404244 RepID=UPI0009E0623D
MSSSPRVDAEAHLHPRIRSCSEPESVYYANCTAACAAGAAPVLGGQQGYGSHLDRDCDGIGCEN